MSKDYKGRLIRGFKVVVFAVFCDQLRLRLMEDLPPEPSLLAMIFLSLISMGIGLAFVFIYIMTMKYVRGDLKL